ncbi:hypothetical protein [Rhizobium sp. CECT 9324]|uniref:hypothetical protein n=1 Tax=Rhizobium sp. CECT 9324 TaxID=2845820 RepID=UPI001E38D84F|nr:hypothetical protein [Rhizobium sp. CECT 9324]CAH0339600.1 hypothetical protein RHI9324_01251 [Rhizobium sp. CECT 9324]
MSKITLREAAQDLLDAHRRGPHVSERADLWRILKAVLAEKPEGSNAPVIAGVTVDVLLDQCERLAEPIRANTKSFQYASALDNCVAVIKALRDMDPSPQTRGDV